MKSLIMTLDRKKRPSNPAKTGRAERIYAGQLKQLAAHVGQIINGFPANDPAALPSLTDMLRKYSEIIAPWAEQAARRMLTEVNQRDIEGWRQMAGALSDGVRGEILAAPTGELFRRLQAEQVNLIRSIPTDAALRVHELTMRAVEDGTRASEIAKRIMESGQVSQSRAMLIARTEVSRAQSNFTQARAQHIGSEGYVWRTSKDGDVRPSHRVMNGKLIKWDDPPTLDGMTGHAGCLPNCRCWADVQIPD